MKRHTYPHFRATTKVSLMLGGSSQASVCLVVAFYISHWDEIHRIGRETALYKLQSIGVPADSLKNAECEVEVTEYIAIDPRGVRRDWGTQVQAFYLHDPKKRDVLIRQRRLVPDSHKEMLEIYGPKVATVAINEGAPA